MLPALPDSRVFGGCECSERPKEIGGNVGCGPGVGKNQILILLNIGLEYIAIPGNEIVHTLVFVQLSHFCVNWDFGDRWFHLFRYHAWHSAKVVYIWFWYSLAKVWLSMIFIFEVSHSFGQKMCLPSGISNFWAEFCSFRIVRTLFMKWDVFLVPPP